MGAQEIGAEEHRRMPAETTANAPTAPLVIGEDDRQREELELGYCRLAATVPYPRRWSCRRTTVPALNHLAQRRQSESGSALATHARM